MLTHIVIVSLLASMPAPNGPGIVNTFERQVEGAYIVRFIDGLSDESVSRYVYILQSKYGGTAVRASANPIPTALFNGWSKDVASSVSFESFVQFVDEDGIFQLSETQSLRASADQNSALDRIDQRQDALDFRFRRPLGGRNALIYIVDTGVDKSAPSLLGRLSQFHSNTFVDNLASVDTHGHGTQMASLAAGSTLGIAPFARIGSVKVTEDGIIKLSKLQEALTWILFNEVGVVNLSLSLPAYTSTPTVIDQLVAALTTKGFIVVAAAGNDSVNVTQSLPARSPTAITVGAIGVSTHQPLTMSNWGPGIDIWAPGENLLVESPNGNRDLKTGTSGSAALTSGVVAALLEAVPQTEAVSLLLSGATQGRLQGDLKGAPNRLLFSDLQPALIRSDTQSGTWAFCTAGVYAGYRLLNNIPTASVIDAAGNTYLAFTQMEPYGCNTWNWGTTPTQTFIEKRTPSGTLLWSQVVAYGSSWSDGARGLLIEGDVVFAAGTTSSCTTPACETGIDAIVYKLNASTGLVEWSSRISSVGVESARGLAFSADGANLLVAGTTSGALSTPLGGYDFFVSKVAKASGALRQTIQFGTAGNDFLSDFAQVGDITFVAVGSTTGAIAGATPQGATDAVAIRVIDSANGLFASNGLQLGTPTDDEFCAARSSVETLANGTAVLSLFVAGRTRGVLAGSKNEGGFDIFWARYDDDTFIPTWSFQTGTAGDEGAPSLALTPDDIFLLGGNNFFKASRVSGHLNWSQQLSTPQSLISIAPTERVLLHGTENSGAYIHSSTYKAF